MSEIGDIDFEYLSNLPNHDRYNFIMGLKMSVDSKMAVAYALLELGVVTKAFVIAVELMLKSKKRV